VPGSKANGMIEGDARQRAMRGSSRRRFRWAAVLAAVAGLVGLVGGGLSCTGPLADTCEELGTCAPAGRADASADGAADAGTGDVSAEGPCDPTGNPKDEPCVLDDAYGVFVAAPLNGGAGPDGGEAGMPSGDGTMSSPYTTIGQALANLGSKTRIYVCNGVYGEQLSITTAVSMYGGLSCPTGSADPVWRYVGASAQVSSPSASYALSVTGVSSGAVTVEDMSFAAPDASSPGTSSIAALVSSSSVNMVRVTLSAGGGANGAAGADGSVAANYSGAVPVGGAQAWTTINGLFSAESGGTGSVNQCKTFGASAGGNGALGCATAAAIGTPGSASPEPPVTTPGRDGLPMGSPLPGDAGVVSSNDPGADGQTGSGGAAAPAQVYGALAASGWTANPGGSGATGNPGQGGAGATDPLYGQCAVAAQDIGGGGGGAGGCGGAGGMGGGGGGASIALATLDSTVTLTACTLNASDAGTGGAGGAGQDGQGGAAGGDDMSFSGMHAAGAAGGNGAGGSGGAGGTGGISVGILESGSSVIVNMAATASTSLGAAGAGGAAGPAGRHGVGILATGVDGNSGASGSAGTAVAVLSLM
jgi:hypothetical protein